MGASQRRKGVTGEREWVNFLRERGVDATRFGQCGQRDVRTVLAGAEISWECKRVARARTLYRWLEQAHRLDDSGCAAVAVREDFGKWLVVMDAETFVRLLNHEHVP